MKIERSLHPLLQEDTSKKLDQIGIGKLDIDAAAWLSGKDPSE